MKTLPTLMLASLGAATLAGCATTRYDDSYGYYDRAYYAQNGRYDYDRPDPQYGYYDAGRYYRQDPRYRSYAMRDSDRVYRGDDGRYYCRRSDGTTGLVVGGVAGAALGNVIAPRGAKTLGTILGAVGGAAAGASIERSGTRCE
jgi:hypothetical protein